MRLVAETKLITIEITEKEYIFIKWCLANADTIDIVPSGTKQPLNLSETPKKVKFKYNNTTSDNTSDEDEIPF